MNKEQIRKKLAFKKQLIANLNQEASNQVLGGGTTTPTNTMTCPSYCPGVCTDLNSTSTGCYRCECDEANGNN